jgi:hypothetical protein
VKTIKRAKEIKRIYEEMDEASLKNNGFRMYNSLSKQIDWLYSEYTKICSFCNEQTVSKVEWLSQDITPSH